jgi:hypothetical protein
MKNKHQNHTTNKLLLQTRCPHSPLSLNAELTSIKQNKHTYIISAKRDQRVHNNYIAPFIVDLG